MLYDPMAPLSSYWSCQFLGTILRMWLTRSVLSKGRIILVDNIWRIVEACEEVQVSIKVLDSLDKVPDDTLLGFFKPLLV